MWVDRTGHGVLDETFAGLFFHLRPRMPRSMVVFEVDAGKPTDLSIVISAAEFENGDPVNGEQIGPREDVIIAREYARLAVETKGNVRVN